MDSRVTNIEYIEFYDAEKTRADNIARAWDRW